MAKISADDVRGVVLEIQRMSTEDGPGLRTTVFLKGCPLRCAWCHNPESIKPDAEVQWIGSRCIGCGTCITVCRQGALGKSSRGIDINRKLCVGCGDCAKECPSTAMETLGTLWSVKELVRELLKDRAYFENSGGGVTLSGGEATMQPRFALEVMRALKAEGVQTALDTCGLCKQETLEELLTAADVALFDIKLMDEAKHKRYTGAGNDLILSNLRFVAKRMKTEMFPKRLWIRTPIIPDATDDAENISAIGRFIAEELCDAVERWELCAFNNLCKDKYKRLSLEWEFDDAELISKDKMEELLNAAAKSGVKKSLVVATGSTRLENREKAASSDAKPKNRPASC